MMGRMKPSSYYDRIVDVMEELVRFTVLLRPHTTQLVDRYPSERKPVYRSIRQRTCRPSPLLRALIAIHANDPIEA
jgi:hypothetical protein